MAFATEAARGVKRARAAGRAAAARAAALSWFGVALHACIVLLACTALHACGARDAGEWEQAWAPIAVNPSTPVEATPPTLGCSRDQDCDSPEQLCLLARCIAGRCESQPRSCDDGDPCTEDSCDPERGCLHLPLTADADGDGHRAPREGFDPGAPGSCGDDCDDRSASSFPGATELCDGVDNDCDGVADGGDLVQRDASFTWLTPDSERSSVSGLAHDGEQFIAAVSVYRERNESELVGVVDGRVRWRRAAVQTNSDSYPGALIWTGQELALAWEDRRDDDFEIYFNRFDSAGRKLGPDQRLSHARGFSLSPDVRFTGEDYLVVWADRRFGVDDFRVFGRRVGAAGQLSSEQEALLTPQTPGASEPRLALGASTVGVLFHRTEIQGGHVSFMTLDAALEPLGPPLELSGPAGVTGALIHRAGRYYAFWYEYDRVPGDAIWVAVIDESGELLQPARRLTGVAPFARHVAVAPLGERLVVAWAEHDGERFGVYVQTFDLSLNPLGARVGLRREMGDLDAPQLAASVQGEVAVGFTERSSGEAQAHLVTLACADSR